jgi:hypothetical protein
MVAGGAAAAGGCSTTAGTDRDVRKSEMEANDENEEREGRAADDDDDDVSADDDWNWSLAVDESVAEPRKDVVADTISSISCWRCMTSARREVAEDSLAASAECAWMTSCIPACTRFTFSRRHTRNVPRYSRSRSAASSFLSASIFSFSTVRKPGATASG